MPIMGQSKMKRIQYQRVNHTFHFPSDPELQRIWEFRVSRDGFKGTSNSVSCDKHFVDGRYFGEELTSIIIGEKM